MKRRIRINNTSLLTAKRTGGIWTNRIDIVH
jgi:hypothetical protein